MCSGISCVVFFFCLFYSINDLIADHLTSLSCICNSYLAKVSISSPNQMIIKSKTEFVFNCYALVAQARVRFAPESAIGMKKVTLLIVDVWNNHSHRVRAICFIFIFCPLKVTSCQLIRWLFITMEPLKGGQKIGLINLYAKSYSNRSARYNSACQCQDNRVQQQNSKIQRECISKACLLWHSNILYTRSEHCFFSHFPTLSYSTLVHTKVSIQIID